MSSTSRNKMLRSNILFSGMLKIVGLCTSFLIVPITLNYLESESYGIWMIISSMAYWIFTFDIGLGNGLRNYLTASISKGDYHLGGIYISSTFAMLALIAFVIGMVATPLIFSLNFNQILNTNHLSNEYLRFVIMVALILTLINFIVKNIGYIYISMQQYAINDLLTVGGNVVALLCIYLLTKTTEGNLFYVVSALMTMPVVIFLLGSIPLFIRYPDLCPSIRKIDFSFNREVIQKSLGFFFIQITSCLVIFGGSNLFISHFSGPKDVTIYNIAFKYFNLLIIGYTIIIAPMWNAYTDAYVKNEWTWIKSTFKKAILFWVFTVIVGALMLIVCNFLYSLWIGESVTIPITVSAAVFTYITFYNLNNCATYLLNGLNTIRVQIYTSVLFTLLYLILITLYGQYWKIEGIVICMASCYALMSLIHLYQCRLLIDQNAKGIWSK